MEHKLRFDQYFKVHENAENSVHPEFLGHSTLRYMIHKNSIDWRNIMEYIYVTLIMCPLKDT